MELPKNMDQDSPPQRKCHLPRRWWVAIGVLLAVIIVAIVTPLATLLPSDTNEAAAPAGQPASVLFPLYIYPETNSSWAPLYQQCVPIPVL